VPTSDAVNARVPTGDGVNAPVPTVDAVEDRVTSPVLISRIVRRRPVEAVVGRRAYVPAGSTVSAANRALMRLGPTAAGVDRSDLGQFVTPVAFPIFGPALTDLRVAMPVLLTCFSVDRSPLWPMLRAGVLPAPVRVLDRNGDLSVVD
jgi:hypothetical protein